MIAVLMLAALVAITPFDCPPVTITLGNTHSTSSATPTTSALEVGSTAATTVTISNTVSILALSTVRITSALEAGRTAATDGSGDDITIAITNTYGKCLSLSFTSNAGGPSPVGNPSATTLPDNAFT